MPLRQRIVGKINKKSAKRRVGQILRAKITLRKVMKLMIRFSSSILTHFRLYCIPEYGDFSTAEIGSHRLMNIFLIFFSLVPKINRHGLMLCHVMPIRF